MADEEENKPNPVGRPKNIDSPQQLWLLFRKYKEWAKATPRTKQDYVGKDGDEVARRLERPLTFVGFEVYLFERMIISDLGQYERNKENRYAEFVTIVRAIKNVIETDQFEGASVGIFQHNIIARKLGLADKQESRNVDKNGDDIPPAPTKIIIVDAKDEADELDIKESEG